MTDVRWAWVPEVEAKKPHLVGSPEYMLRKHRDWSQMVHASVDGSEPRTPAQWLVQMDGLMALMVRRNTSRELRDKWLAAYAALESLLGKPE